MHIAGSSDHLNSVRLEAMQLVDNVLERSVFVINSQQHSLHSESEPFAITCDPNGADLIKSPTIESMSGKSFDDNFSVPDPDDAAAEFLINVPSDGHSFNQTIYEP